MGKKNSSARERLLVVGDWVVDDYWVTGVHRSPTASRTGQAHFRSLHMPGSTVRAPCGAGKVASLLFSAMGPKKPRFSAVHGIGVWHQNDTELMTAMLEDSAFSARNPFSMTRATPSVHGRGMLVNLADTLAGRPNDLPHSGDYPKEFGTTRMIRLFQNTGQGVELLQRVDWELPAPFNVNEDTHAWFPDAHGLTGSPEKAAKSLAGDLSAVNYPEVDGIVIKDLCKGVVSAAMLKELVQRYADKPWFVSSKAWQPSWLEILRDVNLKLLIVPQVAANQASRIGDVPKWHTAMGGPTREATESIRELFRRTGSCAQDTTIVVLPRGLSLLAHGPNPGGSIGWSQQTPEPIDVRIVVAMASAFLPALVTRILDDEQKKRPLREHLDAALGFAGTWMLNEMRWIEQADGVAPRDRVQINVSDWPSVPARWAEIDWQKERESWTAAFENLGVVERTDPGGTLRAPVIDLWRSETLLRGFVCCTKEKHRIIHTISSQLEEFRESSARRHMSCLIVSPPGAGKTSLVRQLAQSNGLRFVQLNITQMLARADLTGAFETIATTQAQSRSEPLLVFVDEINAVLGGKDTHVYDAFLSPLQDGEFIREGRTLRIDPAFWVFAGTEEPDARNISSKAGDFVSRLTIDPLNLAQAMPTTEEARVERVYLGVSILVGCFPDVRQVTRKVLRFFRKLPDDCTVRDLVKICRAFVDVQQGRVHSRNVPLNLMSKIRHLQEFDRTAWQREEEGGYVQISRA